MSVLAAEPIAEASAIALPEHEAPAQPFRGIAPFRFIDQPVFFGRNAEASRLLRLVTMFRGVLLFGDSGAGKSSLLNARFIPDAIADGFLPERIRIQPRLGAEIVIDRIALRERGLPPFIPSNLVADADEPRVVMSCERLQAQMSRSDLRGYPLLIFDQFEEFVTLFEVAPRTVDERAEAAEAQQRLLELLVHFLVKTDMPVKLLFAFREDYFTKLQKLFARCRDLMDQALRLLPPSVDDLPLAIRGPFERNPGMFANALPEPVCAQLESELRERAASGLQNPSEVQIAGLMLWQAKNPQELLAQRKVQGLLEDYLVGAVEALPAEARPTAVALLSCLVTDAGTRNIVSRNDLIERVTQSEHVDGDAVNRTVDALVRDTGLVREEFRDRTAFYQIISEFLVPWIREQKAQRAQAEAIAEERAEAERQRKDTEQRYLRETLRRVRRSRAILSVLLVLLLCGWGFAAWQTQQARRERNRALEQSARADREKSAALSAEDAARTALEQNARTASSAEKRLLEAARALSKTQYDTSVLLQEMTALAATTGLQSNEAWSKLTERIGAVSQSAGLQSQQVAASAQETQQEAAHATSTPGWSLYGKADENNAWRDRYFHKVTGDRSGLPVVGDIVEADTFVNVRQRPSSWDSERKEWVLERILGLVAPKQRIKVAEVLPVAGSAEDPLRRYWIRGEPAPQ